MKYLFFIALLFLVSCSIHGNSSGSSTSCNVSEKNKFVYDNMHDSYLWYNHVPTVDYLDYSSPEILLLELRYEMLDKWSYITTVEQYNQYYEEGTYIGYGFAYARQNNDIYVRFTYANSPASEHLERGQRILEINEKSIEEIDNQNLWGSIFKEDRIGVESSLKLIDNGIEKTVVIKKNLVTINTVLENTIIEQYNKKIGYLAFSAFIEPSKEELKTAFADFKKANVEELILDLRYNGGGRISVAEYLASLIATGDSVKSGSIFSTLLFNDKYSHNDFSFTYTDEPEGLNLNRVYVLTTERTCSSSEMVINGLTPFIDVYIIGDTTCGKPVGSSSKNYCDMSLSKIEFETANSNGQGKFYNGWFPDCFVSDDLSKKLGDISENVLAESLYLMANNSCRSSLTFNSLGTTKIDSQKQKKLLTGFKQIIGSI